MTANVFKSFSCGVEGACDDFSTLIGSWGFALAEVNVPVSVWHGTADRYVPFSMGELYAEKVPNGRLNAVPGEGHFMVVHLINKILVDEFRPEEDVATEENYFP